MLQDLIQHISRDTITTFFRRKVSSFRPNLERLDDYLADLDGGKFRELYKLGEAEYGSSDELLIFSCKYLGELTARSSKKLQYEIAKKILKHEFKDAAIFIFYDETGKFRFSFIRTNYVGTKRDYSTWKRYTYYVDPQKPNKTFINQIGKCTFDNLDAIIKAFSIEAVTDDFYNEFTPTFSALANAVKEAPDFRGKQDFALLFTIRIIFIGFVQKRKWLGEDEEFIQSMWEEYKSKFYGKNLFYKEWLEPLFFEALNSPPGREVRYGNNQFSEKIRLALKMAPYLNGEIFNRRPRLDTEGLYLPDKSIEAFFEFLFQYNFTIEENTNYDEELELNPEFLGIIFERLVNKEDGAVYTPRIEVDFMCRISLVKWLQKVSIADVNDLYYLFFRETGAEENQKQGDFSAKQIEELLDLLKNVTTCDPASGSGAFPVGMMQVLNEIIENLQSRHNTPEKYRNEDAFERKKAIIANSLYGVEVKLWAVWINQLRLWLSLFVDVPYDREDEFKYSTIPLLPNLDFKIRQGDSLVQRIGEKMFPVQGHALIQNSALKAKITSLKKAKIEFFYNRSGSYKHIKHLENEIFRDIINEQIEEKKKVIRRLKSPKQIQGDMFSTATQTAISFDEEEIKSLEEQIAELEAEKNAFKDDHPLIWNIEFSEIFYEKGGFDIIIGNPPYVRQESIADPLGRVKNPKDYKGLLQETMRIEFPKHFIKKEKIDGKSDLYTFFYIKSLRLLNEKGIHTFICSNSWLDVGYGVWLQKFLLHNCQVHFIIDNHAKRSFATADVNTIISVIGAPLKSKRDLSLSFLYKFIAFKKPFEEAIFTDYLLAVEKQQHDILKNDVFRSYPITIKSLIEEGTEYETEGEKTLASGDYIGDKWGGKYLRAPDIFFTLLERGREQFIRLGDVAKIRRGITTGCNEFFYLENNEIENLQIEKQFTIPAILKTNEASLPKVDRINIKGAFFYTQLPKVALKGFKALEYILSGEKTPIQIKQGKDKGKTITGFHKVETVKNRNLWYSLGEREIAPIWWIVAHNDRTIAFSNSKYLCGDNFFEIYPHNEAEESGILLSLNATYITLLRELFGRSNFGGGVLKTQKPDVMKFLVIPKIEAPKKILDRPTNSIFKECGIDPESDIPISEQEPNPLPDRKALDDAVFDAIGLDEEERKEVYRAVCQLVWNRVSKAKSV